jgi:hypothetical protein
VIRLLGWLLCALGRHDWTPLDWTKFQCKRCEKVW